MNIMSGGSLEEQRGDRNSGVKTVLMRFPMAMGTLFEIGTEAVPGHLAKNLSMFCQCPETV